MALSLGKRKPKTLSIGTHRWKQGFGNLLTVISPRKRNKSLWLRRSKLMSAKRGQGSAVTSRAGRRIIFENLIRVGERVWLESSLCSKRVIHHKLWVRINKKWIIFIKQSERCKKISVHKKFRLFSFRKNALFLFLFPLCFTRNLKSVFSNFYFTDAVHWELLKFSATHLKNFLSPDNRKMIQIFSEMKSFE